MKRIPPWPGVWMAALLCLAAADLSQAGWLNWRGPHQNGVSHEIGLPDTLSLDKSAEGGLLWSYDLRGRGTPVVAGNRVYVWGYRGDGAQLREILACLDADTGERLWERAENDFLSDIVYDRYSIGAPGIDGETGNVYWMTSAGLLSGYTADGELLWRHSLMEQFGKLTFPNGRTGAPAIEGDLVIVHGITSNWGVDGPGRDRFYAFDKRRGDLVWSSTPGTGPKDSSFSTPIFADWNGQRVLYSGTGCGNVVAVNTGNGRPLWRFRASKGGINVSVVMHQNKIITLHEDENVDASSKGRMIAVRIPGELSGPLPVELDAGEEAWRNDIPALSTSPVVVGDRVYQVSKMGELCAINAHTGEVLWRHRLGVDQLHASPVYADGKLYVPMWHDGFFVVRPTDAGPQVLSHVALEGELLGAPAVWNGRILIHTTSRLYCFGSSESRLQLGETNRAAATRSQIKAGTPVALQIMPSEVVLRPGERAGFRIRSIDAAGTPVAEVSAAQWRKYVPPSARVRAEMDADFNPSGELVAAADARLSAGAFEATAGDLKGYMRGRILPAPPYHEDFEGFDISVAHEKETDAAGTPAQFAWPPLPWNGARFKWDVREIDGNKALTKTIDNIFFQRAMTFIGHPDERRYTMEADVMSEGNRRMMSDVGVINQRYIITLLGNSQVVQVVSNQDRFNVTAPFSWQPGVWYRIKSRVDVDADGSGVVRAKVWPRDGNEPAAWTIEAPHANAHQQGSPGVYGFALLSRFRVYVDNITVTANE